MTTRIPAVSGKFYPEEKDELSLMLSAFFEKTKEKPNDSLHGIIVPHAGYIYSGQIAAHAYRLVSKKFTKVIILGPNHTVYTNGIVIDSNEYWETPLGKVKVEDLNITFNQESLPHEQEHSIEVQIPFLQYILNDFTITPIVIGDINDLSSNTAAKKIIEKMDDETLLIISTDLSHFYPAQIAKSLDKRTIETIKSLDMSMPIDACGIHPIEILMQICKIKKWDINLVEYGTSEETSGDATSVVGYASFWF
jgi:MEMO1 family protein